MTAGDEDLLPIGEVARRLGVTASTLRYWEGIGLLPPPERLGGKRRYDAEARRQAELVVSAKGAGFTLAEIRVILAGSARKAPPSQIWRGLAARKLPEVERALERASSMKGILEAGIRCECLTLEDCLLGGS